jgi:23S rRNA pseudouridine1911/1915/1917 synthase
MRKRVFIRAKQDPDSLVDLVTERLGADRVFASQLLEAGSIHVNGKRAAGDRRLETGAKVIVFVDEPPKALQSITIVHQDDRMIVVDKPAGMPTQAERSRGSHALDAQVRRTASPSARLIHRLDKEASGLVLFAPSQRECAPLQAALTAGEIERGYVALVDGELCGEGTIRLRIGRHPTDSRLRSPLPEHAPAGEAASSRWRALARAQLAGRPITAVELRLDTGRTHQLRVHLSGIGHPIVGDAPYGGPPFERLCLHAYVLELPHPHRPERVRFHSPLPEPFLRLVPDLTSPFA